MDMDPRLRFLGIWPGQVVNNDDPLGLHRIKFSVPGLIEPTSPWAMPAGMVADHEDGLWSVPEVGMNVWCAFAGADPRRPLWFPGPWGTGDAPQDSIKKRGVRWDDYQLLVDEELHVATLEDRLLGIQVKLDRTTGALTVSSPGNVNISSGGMVRITGTGVQILGRPVSPTGGPI
jgi:phage baseplate assembly protein gpV